MRLWGAKRVIGIVIVAFFAISLTACLTVSPEHFEPIPDEEYYAPEFEEPDLDQPVYDPPEPEPEQVPDTQPGGGISWSDAVSYVGSYQRVCGPFAGWGNSDNDVFLNLGHDYPSLGRFQIVLWDIGWFEPIPPPGATVCTEGPISLYNGVAQIELYDPTRVELYW